MRGPHFRSGHATESALLDFVEGRLADDDRRALAGHLEGCPACRSAADAVGRLIAELGATRGAMPPAHLSHWAASIPTLVAPKGRRAWLRLVADSWGEMNRALAGALQPLQPTPMLRGVDIPHRAGRRRLLFAAGRFDLDLEIGYPGAADPRRLKGQILPTGDARALWTGTDVRLARGRTIVATARLDARGEFVLPKVAAGRYTLTLAGPAPARTPAFEV
jgi:anti-sigma factor RsiW